MRCAIALTLLLPTGLLGSQAPKAPAGAPVQAIQRIAVLGASFSDGFNLEPEVGAPITLSDVVEASLLAGHDPILHKASTIAFTNPVQLGRESVAAARSKDPTLVVGLDFLFWFGYGAVKTEDERMALLEKGLGLLAEFTCPVVVGDFPDMSEAVAQTTQGTQGTQGTKGLLLSKEQVPSPDSLAKLNERLRAWSAEHRNVVVVPIAELLAHVRAEEPITIRGNHWFQSALKGLLQMDKLHPTLEGTVALWLSALDQLVSAREDLPGTAFDWDWKSIYRKAYASKEAERQAQWNRKKKKVEKPVDLPPQPAPPGKGRVPNRLEQGRIDGDG